MGIDWNNREYGIERDDDEPESPELVEWRRRAGVLEEDLQWAVEDRAKLLVVLDAIYNLAWQGMDDTTFRDHKRHTLLAGYHKFSAICDEVAKVKVHVEGK